MAFCLSNRSVNRLLIFYDKLTLPLGITLIIVGQILRSAAMIHASTNFSHTVAFKKRDSHRLVIDGIYAYVLSL